MVACPHHTTPSCSSPRVKHRTTGGVVDEEVHAREKKDAGNLARGGYAVVEARIFFHAKGSVSFSMCQKIGN